MEYQPIFDFIKYSLDEKSSFPESANRINWDDFLAFCMRQNIPGIVFQGIERAKVRIPHKTLLHWVGCTEQIKALNLLTDKRTRQMCHFWEKCGCRSCILKGQANARMYPHPELRTPGDIDIWVEGNDVDITKTVLSVVPDAKYSFHHVKMPVFDDVSVEVHYRPAYLSNWWKDRKLQKLTTSIAKKQFDNLNAARDTMFACLTDEFNALYSIIHMFGHCFTSHNNLKQLIDYFYLLKRGLSFEQREWVKHQFTCLGVESYAAGIMWIEHEMLGLERQYLIIEPDEEIGNLLMDYVLNYGERKKRSKLSLLIHRITDNLPLLRYFPSPVLIGPIYLIWHQWWKWDMHRKLKKH